jgi:hypothetical protein
METSTIIAIILGIITVITVVVVIVIQNKKPTPSPPTTDCEWMEGKWEIDNNTQMNLQDTNYPEECSVVPHNCGNWKRDVKCTSSNGVGNCTDDDCTKTRPVDHINCRTCPPPPTPPSPADDIIKVGDKVKLLYYNSSEKEWDELFRGGNQDKWVTDHFNGNTIPILTIFADGKQLGEPVTQEDKITLKHPYVNRYGTQDSSYLSRRDEYLYLADATELDSYITKFYIVKGITAFEGVLRENTAYNLQDAVAPDNFLDDNSKGYYEYVVFKLRDDPNFVPRRIKLQKV